MTTCNGASVNRPARCGERKTFEGRKSREEAKVLNPQTWTTCKFLGQILNYSLIPV